MTIKLPNHISDLPRYIAGRPVSEVAREYGLDFESIVKLASNENPLGMSAQAKAAILASVDEDARYPDPAGHDLRQKLSQMLDAPFDWLTLGSGSSEILEMAGRAFLSRGDTGLISQYAFSVYSSAIRVTSADLIVVPARDYGHDLEAMAAAVTPKVRLIFVANPNNPTGTRFDQQAFETFMGKVNGRAVVVLDEAYQEYLRPDERFDILRLVNEHSNLIVSRTFSKAYGLAGLRIGYALGQSEVTAALNRVRPTFNVNHAAQAAAAAALSDLDFLEATRELNDAGMAQLVAFCDAKGLEYVPSRGNFLLIRIGDAASVNRQLLQQGVIVRPVANYGLPEWLRVSVGTDQENRRFIDVLTPILENAVEQAV